MGYNTLSWVFDLSTPTKPNIEQSDSFLLILTISGARLEPSQWSQTRVMLYSNQARGLEFPLWNFQSCGHYREKRVLCRPKKA